MNGERLSGGTFFVKRIFPLLWFGCMLFFAVMAFVSDKAGSQGKLGLLLVVAFMALVGALVLKVFVFDLVDEVVLSGDALIVRKGTTEERIRLADVMNVNIVRTTSPNRITLRLRKSGRFGDEVSFVPHTNLSFNPFGRDPTAEKLIGLIDAARRGESAR